MAASSPAESQNCKAGNVTVVRPRSETRAKSSHPRYGPMEPCVFQAAILVVDLHRNARFQTDIQAALETGNMASKKSHLQEPGGLD